jgi:hypothetical protein|tara:strand:+ start:449 stop:568 length:120 start_codon:yes stop_codon:yes gene_type:complete
METEQVFPAREIESDMPDGLKVIILLAKSIMLFFWNDVS